jgi:hypothetical protein
VGHALGVPLQGALLAADDGEAQHMMQALDALLREPGTPFVALIAYALERRPGPPATMEKLRVELRASRRCSFHVLAMHSAPEAQAREALSSSCWLLQAAAYERLEALGAALPEDASRLPFVLH